MTKRLNFVNQNQSKLALVE